MPTAGQPFSIKADHDGINTDGYRVFRGTSDIGGGLKAAVLSDGVATLPVTGHAEGVYDFTVKAYGPGGTVASDPLTVTVTPDPPAKPTNIRLG